jgi:hypothetical protein
VAAIIDRAEHPLDFTPTLLFAERAFDRMRDERAPLPASREAIKLAHQRVVQAYVQAHVTNLAHKTTWTSRRLLFAEELQEG